MYLLLSVLLLFFLYLVFQFKLYYHTYNIPGYSYGILGHLLQGKKVKSMFNELFEKYDNISKCWIGPVLFINLSKPEYIEKIAQQYFEKINTLMKISSGEGVASMNSVLDWKRQRKILNPFFRVSSLNQHYDIINHWSANLVSDLIQSKDDLYSIVFKNQFCMVNECFISKHPASVEDIEENKTLSLRLTKLWYFGLYVFQPIWLLSKEGKAFIDISKKMKKNTIKAVAEAKNNNKQQVETTSFMSGLFESSAFSYKEIVDNVQTLSNAAISSTASAQVFVFVLLAMHQTIQYNLFQEIDSLWDENTDSILLESLKHASLLDRVIKETLRLFPPIPSLLRKADKTIILSSKHKIPKGAHVVIDLLNIHRDRRIWSEPLKFDPDRFLPERFQKIQRGSFAPFWLFSRNCIGQYFSILSLKISVARVVKFYKITGCQYKNVSQIELRTSPLLERKKVCLDFILRKN